MTPLPFCRPFPVLVSLVLASSVGCRDGRDTDVANPAKPEAAIRVSGSGTLVPLFQRIRAAYREENPDANVNILAGTSTGGGVEGVRSGVLQIGLCSRRPAPHEMSPEIAYHDLGVDLIVFAAHHKGRVPTLTPDDLRRIYRGEFRNWGEVGGEDREILVLERDEGESIKITLRSHFFAPSFETLPSATVFLHAEDMAEALRTTPHAIGYAGRGELRSLGFPLTVHPPLGRWPSAEEVTSGRYPLVIPLGIVTPVAPEPDLLRFLRFLQGPRGRAVLDALGCFPAPAPRR